MKQYALRVRALWEQHEENGGPVPPDVVQECEDIWAEMKEPLRALVDGMISFADQTAHPAEASLEDYPILRALSEIEQVTLTRLIALQTPRQAVFTNRLTVYPKNKLVQGRALALQETEHYEMTRKRKHKPAGNVRSQTILGQPATA